MLCAQRNFCNKDAYSRIRYKLNGYTLKTCPALSSKGDSICDFLVASVHFKALPEPRKGNYNKGQQYNTPKHEKGRHTGYPKRSATEHQLGPIGGRIDVCRGWGVQGVEVWLSLTLQHLTLATNHTIV